jgi:hypothetical protein
MVYDWQRTRSGSTIGTVDRESPIEPIKLIIVGRFKKELETRQLNFAVIAGSSWEQRTADAIRCVEEFMKNNK